MFLTSKEQTNKRQPHVTDTKSLPEISTMKKANIYQTTSCLVPNSEAFTQHPRIRPLPSSPNSPVSIAGFPLARSGCRCTRIHCKMRTIPLKQGTIAHTSRYTHATATTLTTVGRSYHELWHRPPWVNHLWVYRNAGSSWLINQNGNWPTLQEV